MQTSPKTLIDLETRFWQSMVDRDTDAALELLSEPALMVSSNGKLPLLNSTTWTLSFPTMRRPF